ncbi:NEDD4-binding protein 2-like 2 [Caerostris darwini]|uniref:NEDD4-binding protein 2-like 2 n=1 Tax=Caerostris darwini TaxID=1538125 RepID=A0AAV4T9P4_9ARAC|nr:NEDD4-binding protein 2-like 2 [Caerostris darwini]
MQKSILEKNPPVKNQVYKAEIFRNSSAVYDDMDPHQSVEYLIDIFKGKVDRDVIEMMFSECCLNVEETVESLMKLANEDEKEVNNNQSGYFDKSSSTLSLKMKNKMPKIIQISEMERSNANTCEGMKNELASTSFKVKENNPTPSTNFVDSIEANYYYLQNYNHLIRPNKGCVWSSDNVWNPPKSEVARPKITFQSIQHQIKDYQQRNYPNSGAFSLNSGVLRNATYASRNFKTTNDGNIELVTLLIRNGKYRSMIILRGLPGSGKSYLAKYLASLDDHCIILSTDDFFNCNGKYVFDWTRLEAAHNWNQRRAKQAVLDGRGPIIIDNTNIEVWEMMPYVSMAKQFGYCLEILEPGTPWKFKVSALAAKNTHGVRKEKIAKMLAKYQYNIDADYFKKFDFKTDLNNDHKSVFDPKERENGKQPILLEAVVHQEEQSPDALREKQNKSINTTVSPSVYRILRRDSLSNVTMNMDKSLVIKDNMISELKDVSNENKIINDLEELKSLVEADSDSQSLTKSDNKSSNQELSSLEEITEHKDLIWKTNSSDNIASFRCDTSSHEEASHSDKITSYDEYISLEVSKTVNFVEELPEQLPKNRESRPMQNCFSNILQRSEKHILQNVIPNNEIKGNDYATNTNLVQSEVTSDDIGNLLHIKKNCKVDSNQVNRQFLHIINSESDKHMNSKSISESEVNNSTVLRKRCTKSLDESSISQQIKNKGCKNTETNLLHSKFSSVPTIQNRLNDCKNSDDVSNGTENTSFIKKLTKNKEKEMALHKSPAAENCLSWNEDEDFNNKPDDLNKIFESENSCINQEKKQNEADSLLNFGKS